MRNRAWFFGAYQPAFTENDARVDAERRREPAGNSIVDAEAAGPVHHRERHLAAQRQTSRARLAYNNSWAQDRSACCRRLAATERTETQLRPTSRLRPNWSLSRATWTGSSRRSCSSAPAAATTRRTSQRLERDRAARPLPDRHDQRRHCPACPVSSAGRHRLLEHPDQPQA